MKVNADI